MGTPTIGGDITGTVTKNSGLIVTGDLDDVGLFTGNNDDTYTIISSAGYGTATINPSTGEWSYDLNDSHPAVQALDPGDTLPDVFTVRMVDADGRSDTQVITITINGAVCFASGTLIDTPDGLCPVEDLRAGDRLLTMDAGAQVLRWRGVQEISPEIMHAHPQLRPVCIAAGAMGSGLPHQYLRVSRQHRMLVRGAVVQAVFGVSEVLIPAINLVGLPGITLGHAPDGIEYHHLLLAEHHVIWGNGAPSESLLTGPQALATLTGAQRAEIALIFPETAQRGHVPRPARLVSENGREIRRFRAALDAAGAPLLDLAAPLVPA